MSFEKPNQNKTDFWEKHFPTFHAILNKKKLTEVELKITPELNIELEAFLEKNAYVLIDGKQNPDLISQNYRYNKDGYAFWVVNPKGVTYIFFLTSYYSNPEETITYLNDESVRVDTSLPRVIQEYSPMGGLSGNIGSVYELTTQDGGLATRKYLPIDIDTTYLGLSYLQREVSEPNSNLAVKRAKKWLEVPSAK